MSNARIRLTLNNKEADVPIGVNDIAINADYSDDNNQPHVTGDEFELTDRSRQIILDWIAAGKTGGVGIFEGMPGNLVISNNDGTNNFPFFIDFRKNYRNLLQDGKLQVAFTPENNIEELFEQMDGMTFGYLESIGHITESDYIKVPYVVEKKLNAIEIIVTSILTYVLVQALRESIRDTAESVATALGMAASGITGSIGATIYKIASAIIQIAYTIAIAIAIINLARNVFNMFLPPKREHKAINFKRALQLVCSYYGYSFETDIQELDKVAYLPSNPNLDVPNALGYIATPKGTQKGIPNSLDYGYVCSEMFQLAKRLFTAKLSIVGNTIQLRPKNDSYWIKRSKYKFPDAQLEVSGFNLDDLNTTVLNAFDTDLNDEWTIDNFQGTIYEVRTSAKSTNNRKRWLGKGFKENRYNTALGSRKDQLNAFEKILKEVGRTVDSITGILGRGSNFGGQINFRIGLLKQSNNWHSIPKLLYLDGQKLPNNHRELFNAKTLYDKYGIYESFVANGWYGQKTVYENVRIPFGMEDFRNLLENSYFKFQGKDAKITNFEWTVLGDSANVSFWVREPYTFNLIEETIYPS